MLDAQDIYGKKLDKKDINFSDIALDKIKTMFTEIKQLYIQNKDEAYKNLVSGFRI
tara:strand:+ start:620 stop:787 length:168 start_codon:yes stop_codon:yes gene_type:complete